MTEPFPFSAFAVWNGGGEGTGSVRIERAGVSIPVSGAAELAGAGGDRANPEELLLAAVAACFVDTWAIFLAKLKVAYAEPSVALAGRVEKDPAGGYRMAEIRISARVPAELLASRRQEIEKTLQLAEKYCIISKTARAAMPVTVAIEEV